MNAFGEYRCECCRGIFIATISDEEALSEGMALFGDEVSADDHSVVCDDCFKKIIPTGDA